MNRWPLTKLWLIAQTRGDIALKVYVNNIVNDIAECRGYQRSPEAYERWLDRVLDVIY